MKKKVILNILCVIDDVGYRTKYGPCEELNSFGNKLNSDYR